VALRVQHRRHVVRVEHDLVVGLALDDTRHADRCKTVAGVALEHQAQVDAADLQRRVAVDRRVAIAHGDLGDGVARAHRAGRLLGVSLDDAGARQHQREHHFLVARIARDVERGRRGVVAGNRKRGAVGSTPCAEFRLSLPSASAASSTDSETKPQP
jgi:hypothetical protein